MLPLRDQRSLDEEEGNDSMKDLTIRDVPTYALQCRDVRCQWERNRKFDMREPLFGTRRSDECARCGNWRHVLQRTDGTLDWSTGYREYSDAYAKAMQFTVTDCRLELDRRNKAKRKPRTEVVRGGRGRPNLRVAS